MGYLSFQLKLVLQSSWRNIFVIASNISRMKAGRHIYACVQTVRMAPCSSVHKGSDSQAAEITSLYQII